jgi:hypothetical protein
VAPGEVRTVEAPHRPIRVALGTRRGGGVRLPRLVITHIFRRVVSPVLLSTPKRHWKWPKVADRVPAGLLRGFRQGIPTTRPGSSARSLPKEISHKPHTENNLDDQICSQNLGRDVGKDKASKVMRYGCPGRPGGLQRHQPSRDGSPNAGNNGAGCYTNAGRALPANWQKLGIFWPGQARVLDCGCGLPLCARPESGSAGARQLTDSLRASLEIVGAGVRRRLAAQF